MKSARESNGLSLSQIQERTKIPYNHLQAIDSGHQEDLPESVYVSGYIKRYADCVGLDGQQLADAFRLGLEKSNHKNGGFLLFTKEQPTKIPVSQNYQKIKIEQSPPSLLKSVPFYAFWIIVVLGLVVFLATHQPSNEGQDNAIVSLKDSTAKANANKQAMIDSSAGSTTSEENAVKPETHEDSSSKDVRLILNASQHVWVEVKSVSSGEVQYTGFLEMGDRRDFHDPQGLEIAASDGGSLTVERDGKISSFGAPGKKLEKSFLAPGSTDIAEQKTTEAGTKNQTNTSTVASAPAKKPTAPKRPVANKAAAQDKAATNQPVRQLSPSDYYGQNGSNTRGMDVPYRYSE